ncbi:tetratricopeptide repeat protein [Rouxiella sp. Mn2063]|uniref:tetratricopeptide repeat protein n=1 Tax=Rouxiella sp. Mn2063 TaxID=3395262 RepID=UPI003BEC8146
MKVWLPVIVVMGWLCGASAYAQIDEPDIKSDCQKAGIYGQAGNVAYQQQDYFKARDLFRDQVAWSEFCHLSKSVIATAYNNIALAYIHQGMYRKANAWLMLAPDDKKSEFNRHQIQQQLDALPVSPSPVGEYWQYAGLGSWNIVEVKSVGKQFEVEYSGLSMGVSSLYYGPATGSFSAITTIKDGKAVYHQTGDIIDGEQHCTVHMSFSGDSLAMRTIGDCGFGRNVRAEGTYIRVES